MGNDRRRHGNNQPPYQHTCNHEQPHRPGQAVQNHQTALWANGLAFFRGSRAYGRRPRRFGILHLFFHGRLWRSHARTDSRRNEITTRTAAFPTPIRENRNAAIFMPSCYAVGAKKALIYAAYRTQSRGSKEKIPCPSKSAFYCVTNPQQRSRYIMAVFRVERNKGYTVMSNHHLRNKDLTLKAKGLLSQMLSLPEDWDYTLAGLSRINRESIDAIRTAVWELEKAGYITRRQGRDEKGKMTAIEYTIYEQPQPPELENPILENPTAGKPILENPTTDNPTSENPMQLNKEIQKTDLPKKEKSNTDLLNTHSIPSHSPNPFPFEDEAAGANGSASAAEERKRKEANDAYKVYEEIIKDNIEYEHFIKHTDIDKDRLDEIVSILLETVCTRRKTIRIAGDDYPAELVKSKFMKLNSSHIEFVFDCMKNNTTKIRNIKQYLKAVLFNAPNTIDSYYTALVNHDMYGGGSLPDYSCNEDESL